MRARLSARAALRGMAGAAGLALLVLFVAVPPIPQSEAFHRFADRRGFLGLPNALDVLSNLGFLAVGLSGLARLRRARVGAFAEPWERGAYATVFAATVAVTVGSAYYHLDPTTPRLFWDRLPIAAVLGAILGIVVGERIDPTVGRRLFVPLLALGVGSTILWRATGDLRLYGFVQFFAMLAVPVLLLVRPPRYDRTRDTVGMLLFYGLAKVCEVADHEIFALGGLVSGHTLKHVLATAAVGMLVLHVTLRRALPG